MKGALTQVQRKDFVQIGALGTQVEVLSLQASIPQKNVKKNVMSLILV